MKELVKLSLRATRHCEQNEAICDKLQIIIDGLN
jgi:hypothetical protein